ncbi:MAG: CDP-alcohol phosphatidyltransferase family protein [Candidatus Falkowbacteria bacterium]|nr:CDP-alcohol phosphatidyltransferase family protein [Candidatus Falkowbacteria bacterium]
MKLNKTFQKAKKVYWHDKILNRFILRFLPHWILPNHITAFRLATTPFVVILMYSSNYRIGLTVFLFVSFTDALDGSLARVRNQVTEWGKAYDPLADKVLIASMVFIIVNRYIDFATSIIIIGLEIVFIVAAWIRKTEGRKIEANIWGKIKMFLQVLGVTFLLLSVIYDVAHLLPFASGILYLAIAFAIVSLLTHGI